MSLSANSGGLNPHKQCVCCAVNEDPPPEHGDVVVLTLIFAEVEGNTDSIKNSLCERHKKYLEGGTTLASMVQDGADESIVNKLVESYLGGAPDSEES
jgi:hypothetical protein